MSPGRPILMLYEFFPPFNRSGTARPAAFARHLPNSGYIPHIITRTADGITGDFEIDERGSCSRSPTLTQPVHKQISALAIRLRKTFGAKGSTSPTAAPSPKPAGKRAGAAAALVYALDWQVWLVDWYVDWAIPAVAMGLKSATKHSPKLIWVSAPNVRNLLPAYVLSKVLRLPLVVDLRDPWTYGSLWDEAIPITRKPQKAWASRILGHASKIVLTSPLTMREMQARFPADARKMCTITNGFEPTEIEPLRAGHAGKCLFRYTGVLNERRSPKVLLAALRRAAEDPEFRASVHLEFVGGMAGYQGLIAEYGLESLVSWRPHVPKEESEQLIRGSDVNVVLQTIHTGQDVIAGKTFDYLAARKPILAVVAVDGGDAQLLREAGAGEIVSFQDEAAVAEAFHRLWEQWKRGEGNTGVTESTLNRYTRSTLTAQLAAVFDELLGPR